MKSQLIREKICSSAQDTIDLAKELKEVFKSGDCITLNGNLGAGKTFFVKCFGRLFDIDDVKSPTFTLANNYHIGPVHIQHLDFYRINDIKELEGIGINEILAADAISFIEWGSLFPAVLPDSYYSIEIEHSDDLRKFKVCKNEN